MIFLISFICTGNIREFVMHGSKEWDDDGITVLCQIDGYLWVVKGGHWDVRGVDILMKGGFNEYLFDGMEIR